MKVFFHESFPKEIVKDKTRLLKKTSSDNEICIYDYTNPENEIFLEFESSVEIDELWLTGNFAKVFQEVFHTDLEIGISFSNLLENRINLFLIQSKLKLKCDVAKTSSKHLHIFFYGEI